MYNVFVTIIITASSMHIYSCTDLNLRDTSTCADQQSSIQTGIHSLQTSLWILVCICKVYNVWVCLDTTQYFAVYRHV